MITGRTELTCHGLRYQSAQLHMLRQHRERQPRELYTSPTLRTWFKDVLPTLQSTAYATHQSPHLEACTILGRFAAGAPIVVEPDENIPGDIKRLDHAIWELKTGDIRIFGWFHDHDCFVAHSAGDATHIKTNRLYGQHVNAALDFLLKSGLTARAGDHRYVLTSG